jgi:hypothetical protein
MLDVILGNGLQGVEISDPRKRTEQCSDTDGRSHTTVAVRRPISVLVIYTDAPAGSGTVQVTGPLVTTNNFTSSSFVLVALPPFESYNGLR